MPRTAAQFLMPVTFDDVKFGIESWNLQLCEGVAAIDGMQSCGLRGGARFGSVGDRLFEGVSSFRLPYAGIEKVAPADVQQTGATCNQHAR